MRMRILPAALALLGAAALAGCSVGGGTGELAAAVSEADERVTDVEVTEGADGLSRYVAVWVSIDGDDMSADQLRSLLTAVADNVDGGYREVRVGATNSGEERMDGADVNPDYYLDLAPAAAELGLPAPESASLDLLTEDLIKARNSWD